MKLIIKEIKSKDILLIITSVLLIIFQVWLDLKIPDYMSTITRLVQSNITEITPVIKNGAYMLLCAGGSLISAFIVGFIASGLSSKLSRNLRKKLYDKVLNLSMGDVKKFKTSSLITRTTNDISNIQMFVSMGLQLMIKAPILAVWAIIKILNKNFYWSLSTFICILVMLSIICILMITVMPRFKKVQKLIDSINGKIRDELIGLRVIRAFNAEKFIEDKFEGDNVSLTSLQKKNQKSMAMLSPIIYLLFNFLPLSIYLIGASLLNNALMADRLVIFGDMVVFTGYAMQVVMAFLLLGMTFAMYPRCNVSIQRIKEVIDSNISITDGSIDNSNNRDGEIEFKNVSFMYPDASKNVIENISFKVRKGETFAIIGSTGSGKSTIVNLLMRFYDATSGEVLIDGINIKDYKLNTLYKKLGYVPQKAVMFNDTVKNNIIFGDNIEDALTFNNSIEISQSKEFVSKMKDKEEALISQGGTNISGGQKQRLAIARAINRNPEIFIFDDSFSALDYETDHILRKEINSKLKSKTNIIVAQRIGTIINADQIMVLEKGKCVGIGSHKELLKDNKVYREIALSQLLKEELENEE